MKLDVSFTPQLKMQNVAAGYGKVSVLRDVSLASEAGRVVTILGSNGSGKSTSLKVLMGLADQTGGRIVVGEQDISRSSAYRRVRMGLGYVPQTENVFGDLSVNDNLTMGAFLHPAETADLKADVLDLFPQLKPHLRKEARLLSGGERRMLSIAQTLMTKPHLLLMDEPSSDLSPRLVEEVFAKITELCESRGHPILLVEQNVGKALEIAHRVVVLSEGRSVLSRPVGDLTLAELGEIFLGHHPVCAEGAGTNPYQMED